MRVVKRSGVRPRAAASAAPTAPERESSTRVTKVGGASSISCASRRRSASAGRSQACSWISPWSIATRPAGAAARKNQVWKRTGAIDGGVQCEKGTRPAGSTARPASSTASRTAAQRAAPSSSAGSSPARSASSTLPPGKTHMPPKAIFELRRSISVSRAEGASRTRITVAAGRAGLSIALPSASRDELRGALDLRELERRRHEQALVGALGLDRVERGEDRRGRARLHRARGGARSGLARDEQILVDVALELRLRVVGQRVPEAGDEAQRRAAAR